MNYTTGRYWTHESSRGPVPTTLSRYLGLKSSTFPASVSKTSSQNILSSTSETLSDRERSSVADSKSSQPGNIARPTRTFSTSTTFPPSSRSATLTKFLESWETRTSQDALQAATDRYQITSSLFEHVSSMNYGQETFSTPLTREIATGTSQYRSILTLSDPLSTISALQSASTAFAEGILTTTTPRSTTCIALPAITQLLSSNSLTFSIVTPAKPPPPPTNGSQPSPQAQFPSIPNVAAILGLIIGLSLLLLSLITLAAYLTTLYRRRALTTSNTSQPPMNPEIVESIPYTPNIDASGILWPSKVQLTGSAKEFHTWTRQYEKERRVRRSLREGQYRGWISGGDDRM